MIQTSTEKENKWGLSPNTDTIPGFAINSGLGVTESSIGGTFGGAVKNIGTKVNKVYGAYNLGVCMEDCKKVCNKDTCDQDI